jgi:hypothetical protein
MPSKFSRNGDRRHGIIGQGKVACIDVEKPRCPSGMEMKTLGLAELITGLAHEGILQQWTIWEKCLQYVNGSTT